MGNKTITHYTDLVKWVRPELGTDLKAVADHAARYFGNLQEARQFMTLYKQLLDAEIIENKRLSTIRETLIKEFCP